MELRGNDIVRDDALGGHQVVGLIDHGVAVDGLRRTLVGHDLYNLEVVFEAHSHRIAGNDGLRPREHRHEGVEVGHLAILQRETGRDGGQELRGLSLVTYREMGGTTSRTAHNHRNGQLGRSPSVGRQSCLVFALGQQAEGAVGVVVKEAWRCGNLARRHVIEQRLDFRHCQLACAIGRNGEGLGRLTTRRCRNAEVRGGHDLLQLHGKIHILRLLGGIGQHDIEVLARVADIEQYLRRQYVLDWRHSNDDILGQGSSYDQHAGQKCQTESFRPLDICGCCLHNYYFMSLMGLMGLMGI